MEMAAAVDAASTSEEPEAKASNEAAVTEVTVPAENNVATAEVCVLDGFKIRTAKQKEKCLQQKSRELCTGNNRLRTHI